MLRQPELDDATALLEAFADPEVMRYIGTGEPGGIEDVVAQIERWQREWQLDGTGRFVVVRQSDGAVLGRVGLLAWDPADWQPGFRAEIGDHAETELGWTLARSAWGHGYATEAARAVAAWALEEVRPSRLISLIHPDNVRSQAVATRIGEQRAGSIVTHRGIPADLWTF